MGEAQGIFEHVTRPRLQTIVTGVREDGSTYSKGLLENISFFELSYEDPERVRLDLAFEAISPLLWMRAGGIGDAICKPSKSFVIGETYGILLTLITGKHS